VLRSFFFSSRRRHTRFSRDWSSDVCSSDLPGAEQLDLASFYKRNRGEGFGAEVKRRILTGTYVLSAGYYDAYYLKAQKVRKLIRSEERRVGKEGSTWSARTRTSNKRELGTE